QVILTPPETPREPQVAGAPGPADGATSARPAGEATAPVAAPETRETAAAETEPQAERAARAPEVLQDRMPDLAAAEASARAQDGQDLDVAAEGPATPDGASAEQETVAGAADPAAADGAELQRDASAAEAGAPAPETGHEVAAGTGRVQTDPAPDRPAPQGAPPGAGSDAPQAPAGAAP
ncbi:hypothetical protein DRV85_17545, partial [Rhodosalinus halophilus]